MENERTWLIVSTCISPTNMFETRFYLLHKENKKHTHILELFDQEMYKGSHDKLHMSTLQIMVLAIGTASMSHLDTHKHENANWIKQKYDYIDPICCYIIINSMNFSRQTKQSTLHITILIFSLSLPSSSCHNGFSCTTNNYSTMFG